MSGPEFGGFDGRDWKPPGPEETGSTLMLPPHELGTNPTLVDAATAAEWEDIKDGRERPDGHPSQDMPDFLEGHETL